MAKVLTPGGYRDWDKVQLAGSHEQIFQEGSEIRARDLVARKSRRLGDFVAKAPGMPLMPGAVARFADANLVAPALGTGWIAYAGWQNTTGHPVTNFTTRWTVPPPPAAPGGQTIFLFNGIQSSDWILQPVLQWGVSAIGGGQSWAVASWYVDGTNGLAVHSALTDVAPGDVLTGVMSAKPSVVGSFDYQCEFSGIAESRMTVHAVPELIWCNVTLEAYQVASRDSYPAIADTVMSGISLRSDGAALPVGWTKTSAITDVGQYCALSPDAHTGPDVVLGY